jgi:peptidoglycan L-alanyl-D-glutamate endopeptidase CwlK
MNSRDLNELIPEVRQLASKLIAACDADGIDLIITSTYRDFAAQDLLYAQGRSPASKARGEKVVTNAKAGQSAHNFRIAFDVCPIVNGKANWNDLSLWARIGAHGKRLGLEWAGDWTRFKEYAHFQQAGQNLAALLKTYPTGRSL